MSDLYSLRLYDTELVRFSMEKRGLEGLVAEVLSVQKDKSHLMPLDLELTDKGIVHWLEHRVIPKNRAFVDEILKALGLGPNDTKGIIDVCKGLSLGDSYWVVPGGFEGTFSEYNLYQNRFSEMLALRANPYHVSRDMRRGDGADPAEPASADDRIPLQTPSQLESARGAFEPFRAGIGRAGAGAFENSHPQIKATIFYAKAQAVRPISTAPL